MIVPFVQYQPIYALLVLSFFGLFLYGMSYYDDNASSVVLSVWIHHSYHENGPFLTKLFRIGIHPDFAREQGQGREIWALWLAIFTKTADPHRKLAASSPDLHHASSTDKRNELHRRCWSAYSVQ